MPKSVIAFFAAMRKILGKAEDLVETTRHASGFADSRQWSVNIVVRLDPIDGCFIAECPEIPAAMSQGETEREAVANLVDAVKAVLEVGVERHFETLDAELSTSMAEGYRVMATEALSIAEGDFVAGAETWPAR